MRRKLDVVLDTLTQLLRGTIDVFSAMFAVWIDVADRILLGPQISGEVIQRIADEVVGVSLDLLTPETVRPDVREKVDDGRRHLEGAATILSELKNELHLKATELELLDAHLSEQKQNAQHFTALAEINQAQSIAAAREIRKAVEQQLGDERERNTWRRRISGAVTFVLGVIVAGVLGQVMPMI